jgi:hypothetical protein
MASGENRYQEMMSKSTNTGGKSFYCARSKSRGNQVAIEVMAWRIHLDQAWRFLLRSMVGRG